MEEKKIVTGVEETKQGIAFKSGISFLSISAILYTAFIFIPTQIFLNLMTGTGAAAGAWFTLLIWIEIGKISGVKLSKQEAFMILSITGLAIYFPLSQVYLVWYQQSAQAALFNIGPEIPTWACPPLEANIFTRRTFLNPVWFVPILLEVLTIFAGELLSMGLSLFAREVYIEVEELSFPLQEIDAQALVTLTGKEVRQIRYLSVFAVFGFIYGFLMYVIPFIYQAWTGTYIQVIPVPWIDLNNVIERFLPGAILGISTGLGAITGGIVLPLNTVIGLCIGSIGAYIIGSGLSVSFNLVDVDPVKPGMQSWWAPGMNISLVAQRYSLYFWAVLLIGFSLSVGFGPILRHSKVIISAFSKLLKPLRGIKRRTDPVPSKIIFLPLIAGFIIYIAIPVILVPDFLYSNGYWFIPLIVGTPIIQTLIMGRMIGETGYAEFPAGDVKNLCFVLSGYPGVDIWFVPISIGRMGGDLTTLRVAQLTETSSTSYYKMLWLMLPLSIFIGYFFMETFWRIAPIPSVKYPGVNLMWPIGAVMQSLWIRGMFSGLFNTTNILYAFIVGTAIYFVLDFLHSSITFIAIAAGLGMLPTSTIALIIGVMIKIILGKLLGKNWIEENKFLVAAGLLIGESIAVVIGISISIMINSVWTAPY